MAKIHGVAGSYLMSEARKRLYMAMGTALTLMMAYGWAAGYASFVLGWVGAGAAAVMAAGAVYGSLHLIGRRTEALQHERQMYVRGAMGEQLVGWMLEDLGDDWHVFHGIQLQDGQDLDHVVVGPGGLFYIQTKNVGGLFSVGTDGQPLHNNQPTKLLAQTLGQAMNLKERLEALLGSTPVWMNAVLAVPFAHVESNGQVRNVLVLNHGDLSGRLESTPRRLSRQDVHRYAHAIAVLATSARQLRRDGKRLMTVGPRRGTPSGTQQPR